MPHMSLKDGKIRCAILTISDSRTADTDESGRLAKELIEKSGHAVTDPTIVPNEPEAVRAAAERLAAGGAAFILTIGGTGISPRDRTIEAVRPLLRCELPGFGELFRMLSYDEIGSKALLSRALMGVTREGCVLACVPGSRGAVRLALERLLLPELRHVLHELTK
jgi:molybdenum cofactor biosynthesis protein B